MHLENAGLVRAWLEPPCALVVVLVLGRGVYGGHRRALGYGEGLVKGSGRPRGS